MRQIWKWILKDEETVIQAPVERFLTAQLQHGEIAVWGLVETRKPDVEWLLYVVGTGQPLLDSMRGEYLGTVQMLDGLLIGHVFAQKILTTGCETGWI